MNELITSPLAEEAVVATAPVAEAPAQPAVEGFVQDETHVGSEILAQEATV